MFRGAEYLECSALAQTGLNEVFVQAVRTARGMNKKPGQEGKKCCVS